MHPTLIGTTGANRLSVENAVRAIVRGVVAANRSLQERGLLEMVRVTEIVFVERDEDLAIAAALAVRRLDTKLGGGLNGELRASPHLSSGGGGLPGQPLPDSIAGEWRPLVIESEVIRASESDDSNEPVQPDPNEPRTVSTPAETTSEKPKTRELLHFKSVGLLARAEESEHPGQYDIIEKLVQSTVNNSEVDEQTYNTLYELLVPNYLKGLTAESDNLMLVLNDRASRFPWEMLSPHPQPKGEGNRPEPLAVRTGMIRRLLTEEFRGNSRRASGKLGPCHR